MNIPFRTMILTAAMIAAGGPAAADHEAGHGGGSRRSGSRGPVLNGDSPAILSIRDLTPPLVAIALVLGTVGALPAESNASATAFAMPVRFEPNIGQSPEDVVFMSRSADWVLHLRRDDVHLMRPDGSGGLRLSWANERSVKPVGIARQPGTVNFFRGSDPALWRTGIPTYGGVRYDDVYPGIDLIFRGSDGSLEYDFVVAPGADPAAIELRFSGQRSLRLDDDGSLVIETDAGEIRQHAPVLFQQYAGNTEPVAGAFVLDGGRVSFRTGPYDAARTLVIDPVVEYATFVGGGGDEWGLGLTVDGEGAAYVTGYTTSLDFPTSDGSPQDTAGGGWDAFVTKLSPDGRDLVYSTYFAGGQDDWAGSVAVDASGSAYVVGWTDSTDFPTTASAWDPSPNGGRDGFLVKLSPDGDRLAYATLIGAAGADEAWAISVTEPDLAYVVGSTTSCDFPTTPGAFQRQLDNGLGCDLGFAGDAFVVKLRLDGSGPDYATYVGGSSLELAGYEVAVDAGGAAYTLVLTSSPDFPATTDTTFNGATDVAVVKLSPDGADLAASTLLGGVGHDDPLSLALEPPGFVTLAGDTTSPDFPTTAGAFDETFNGATDLFVTRLSTDLSTMAFSTFIGGASLDEHHSVVVGSDGTTFVSGGTASPDFPLTPDAIETTRNHLLHALVARLSADGTQLMTSTLLTGSPPGDVDDILDLAELPGDMALRLVLDKDDALYVSGYTAARDFRTTPDAYDRTHNGQQDTFVLKLIFP